MELRLTDAEYWVLLALDWAAITRSGEDAYETANRTRSLE
jgi:hypothetical protein